MNRKIAVAAIVGGLMQTMSSLRGQEIQQAPARVRPSVPRGDASLKPTVIDDLQRQVAELTRRVDALEQAKANSVGFTKVGNDFVFAPDAGNVTIKAPMGLTLEGASTIRIAAGATITQKATTILLN